MHKPVQERSPERARVQARDLPGRAVGVSGFSIDRATTVLEKGIPKLAAAGDAVNEVAAGEAPADLDKLRAILAAEVKARPAALRRKTRGWPFCGFPAFVSYTRNSPYHSPGETMTVGTPTVKKTPGIPFTLPTNPGIRACLRILANAAFGAGQWLKLTLIVNDPRGLMAEMMSVSPSPAEPTSPATHAPADILRQALAEYAHATYGGGGWGNASAVVELKGGKTEVIGISANRG